SQFATIQTPAAQTVEFEVLADVALTKRTDQVGAVFDFNSGGATYHDDTAEAITPTGNFAPLWVTANGDALYIGHPDVMFDEVDITIAVGQVNIVGVWEYYDGNYDQGQPTSVTNTGSALLFGLNGVLGTSDMTGTIVRVRSAVTGHFQDIAVVFSAGTNQITTSGVDPFLGQTTPSTLASDYIVGTAWRTPTGLVDTTAGLTTSGKVNFPLPQTINQQWTSV